MKQFIKDSGNFFLGILAIGLFMELMYSQFNGTDYNFRTGKIVIYAIASILYASWKYYKRNNSKSVEES